MGGAPIIDALLARMTLDEKLAQLAGVWSTELVDPRGELDPARAAARVPHGTGHVTRIGGATGLRPRARARLTNQLQRWLVEETRLGIPAIVHEEGLAGLCAREATQFPQAIGLAATWSPATVEAVATVVREQMRACGARQVLAPVLDVARDPRWGRTEETWGEDPWLVGRLGVAYVRGAQGDDLRHGVAATGKHFVAHGAPLGGLNCAPVDVGPRALRDVHAAPFRAAIEAGLAAVMNAYGSVDGLPCAGSPALLRDLLRGELGFEGVVVADYFSVRLLETFHGVAGSLGEAARLALEAGIDVELPAAEGYGAPLRALVERGEVPVSRVDEAARRVLDLKRRLGLFDAPYIDVGAAAEVHDRPSDRSLAREAATRSMVLLKNEGALVPLDPSRLRSVALLGPAADDVRLLQGDYHYPAHLEVLTATDAADEMAAAASALPRPDDDVLAPGPWYGRMVSIAEGVRAALGPGVEVRDEAEGADVAIVCVGGRSGLVPECTSGEARDASSLRLPGQQLELVRAAVASGTPTVAVLVSGRPLALPWVAEHVPAVLAAWIPGQEGGHAVADVLFGRAEPGGRLPITLPRSVGQVPVHHAPLAGGGRSQFYGDYSDGPAAPLWPFGHGLGWTTWRYADLVVAGLEVALTLHNTGDRDAEEVVQVYARDLVASVARPVQQLVAFDRVAVRAGAARRVTLPIDLDALAFHDARMVRGVEPGAFELRVGRSAADIRLVGGLVLHAEEVAA